MSEIQGVTPRVSDRSTEPLRKGDNGLRRRSFLKALGGVAGGVAALTQTDIALAGNGWSSVLSQLPKEKLLDMYDKMLKSRWWETGLIDVSMSGKDNLGGFHIYIGEEAVANGAIGALNPDDYVASTHRNHGHVIAKGGDLNKMSAEMFLKETGYNKGYGGSMHFTNMKLNISANGIVGPGHMLAAGAAYGFMIKGSKQVAMSIAGDGSVNNGWFYSGLRNAALYKAPLVVVIENNGYQVTVPWEDTNPLRDVSKFAAGLEIPGYTVDGTDVLAVYAVTKTAVDRARAGLGPTLIEAKTYRFYDHQGLANAKIGQLGAFGLPYRSDLDVRAWIANDPLPKFRNTLIANGFLTEQQADKMEADVKKQVQDSIEFARNSPEPKPEAGLDYIYAQGTVEASQRKRLA